MRQFTICKLYFYKSDLNDLNKEEIDYRELISFFTNFLFSLIRKDIFQFFLTL